MEVEDAILELLQPLRETPGAKTVAAFQGQPDKDTWARLRRGFPAVLVLYAGSPAFMPSGRRLEERMEFEVYVMDKSYRSAANGQKPEPGHPGTYALLAAARERLLGVPPLPGMGPCLPSSIQGFVLDGASVYRMTVSTIHNIALEGLDMTASPQTRNYLYGKGELFFRAVGSEGYDHLGNAPAFTISLTEEKLEHFSSMSGTKTKDLQLVTQKGATVAFTLEEFTTGNILRAFKGAAVAKQMQAAATVSGQSVSANKGLYTFVGKEKLGFTRLEHGTVAGGTFAPGSSVVGSTSSATATVAYVTDGVLECVNVRGTFVPGEEIAASAIKATLQGIAHVADVVLTDKASAPTVRYRQGVDYDLNARTGLLRVRESCSADTVFLTADCESSDEQLVDALTASDVTGELLFVGQPDQGPGLVVQCWKVTLSLSGEVGLISEELASIPMTGEVLADDLNHPESPFFRVRYLG